MALLLGEFHPGAAFPETPSLALTQFIFAVLCGSVCRRRWRLNPANNDWPREAAGEVICSYVSFLGWWAAVSPYLELTVLPFPYIFCLVYY